MNSDFPEQLRQLRLKAGLNQAQLGREAKVSAALISDLEHGKKGREPGRVTIQKLAVALKLKGEDARDFILAGLKLSFRDRVLPEAIGYAPEILNRLAVMLREEVGIFPGDIERVCWEVKTSKAAKYDLVVRLKNGESLGVNIKIQKL